MSAILTDLRESARRPLPGAVQAGLVLFVAASAESLVRRLYPADSAVLIQRLGEVYGWLSLAALLLVFPARRLRLMPYRRALGLAGFAYALLHTAYTFGHTLAGRLDNLPFLSPVMQGGIVLGGVSLALLVPLALTSTNFAIRRLGRHWRTLHRLGPPATLLAALHGAWIGVHFGLWPLAWTSAVLLALSAALYLTRRSSR
ncbi:ferric reductase-like transmembrane domain-containing protein [Deinococcus pimensis]|uniref:ferric reductase-like transmembrane domain-containing protein n=1 Tax=Deinococcus pimensis TaxID=309888 RepID=UPI00048375BE|nr:ferric reductase-like transmembrane domain-containing protein [Deinococcus pimensis]